MSMGGMAMTNQDDGAAFMGGFAAAPSAPVDDYTDEEKQ